MKLIQLLMVMMLPSLAFAHSTNNTMIIRKIDQVQNLLDQNRVYRAQSILQDLRDELAFEQTENGSIRCIAQVLVTNPDRPKKAMQITVKAFGPTEEIAKARITEKCMDRGGFSLLVCKNGARSAECRNEGF